MRAFVVPEFSAAGSVTQRPKPQAGEGQVLVRIHAAGLNAVDNAITAGYMKDFVEHRFPLVPGLDLSGVVEAVGPGVTGVAVGDEVFGPVSKPYFGEGTFAEYATATASAMRQKPRAIDHATAAALPTAGATALALVDAVAPQPGQTILVFGAGGGVGNIAVQLLEERGARAIAVTRPAFLDHMRGLGASEVMDYTPGPDSVIAAVKARHPEGVDAIIDTHSDKEGLTRLADVVRRGGHLASPRGSADVDALAARGLTGSNSMAEFDKIDILAGLVGAGKVRIPVRTFPLEAAGTALANLAAGEIPGKLVLALD